MKSEEQRRQELREELAVAQARQTGNNVVYIDTDGCEITVTPGGHVFYNVADWW